MGFWQTDDQYVCFKTISQKEASGFGENSIEVSYYLWVLCHAHTHFV